MGYIIKVNYGIHYLGELWDASLRRPILGALWDAQRCIVRFLADIFWAIAHDLKIIAAHALHANSTMV